MATTNNAPHKYPNIYMQWSTARKVAEYRQEGQEPTAEQVQQWEAMDARRTANDDAGKPEPVVAEAEQPRKWLTSDEVRANRATKIAAAEATGYPIPGLYNLAYRAHSGTSHVPDERALSLVKSCQAELADHVAQIQAAGAKAGADAERTQAAADRYAAGYIQKLNAWLSAKSSCISWMITGRSNFPVARAEKANRSEHNRSEEFCEYCNKNLPRAIKSLTTPPTQQEVAAKYTREAEQLVAMQELMKTGNRIVRAAKGADCTEKLVAAGLSEKLAAAAQEIHYGRAGFPAWMLTNNLANIKRVQQRAAEETAKAEAQLAARTEGQQAPRPFTFNGYAGEVVLNLEADRLQLHFEGKPDEETRTQLKKNGMKWSPRFSAWQRQNTANARHYIGQLIGQNLEAPAPVASIEQPAEVEEVAEQLVAEPTPTAPKFTSCAPTNNPAVTDVLLAVDCLDNLGPRKGFEQLAQPAVPGRLVATIHHRDHGSAGTSFSLTRLGTPGRGNTTSNHATLAEATAAAEKYARGRFSLAPAPEPVAEVSAQDWSERDLAADSARLELLADYHGPATPQQEAALPDWHPLSTAANFKAAEAAQAQARAAAGPVTPENQAKVTGRALAGKLTDQQRKQLKWLGFDVPEARSLYTGAKWSPPAAPAPEPADLEQLHAGAHGPATRAQVYELATASPLRLAYDLNPNTGGARNFATIYAAGRQWRVSRNVWERWAGMTDRQAANSGRRAKLEAERTAKKNKALAEKVAKDGPLVALFYGTPAPAVARYTTAQEAEQHERNRRQELHDHHRQFRAQQTRNIRQQLAAMPEAEVARLYTTWQRRSGGYGLEYLLGDLHELAKAKAAEQLVAEPAPADVPQPPAGPQLSEPAAPGWHLITRPLVVAPEHVAQLEQLRELVLALRFSTPAPALFQVVSISEQIPTGSPFWAEARRDGLAIVYGTGDNCAEVLRLALAGQWPVAYTNYTPAAGRHPQARPLPGPPRASTVPPSGAPRRVQIGRSWYTVHRPPLAPNS